MSNRYDGRYITAEEILQVKKSMLKFILRVLEGNGKTEEVIALPQILAQLPNFF